MRITSLTAYVMRLPLRRVVRHAAAEHRESVNLVVCCRLADGTEGWGEGIPRANVTGETAPVALHRFLSTPLAEQLGGSCGDWDDVLELCEKFDPPAPADDRRGMANNALRCAVELAVLDAFARHFRQPLSAVTDVFPQARPIRARQQRVRYSTTITAESPWGEILSALKMRIYGFACCKVKVGMPKADDRRRLSRIRPILGPRVDVRIDANCAWQPDQLVEQLGKLAPYNLSCVEQPVAHEHLEALAVLRSQLPIPVMLDESLTSIADMNRAIDLRACDLVNIRLSKCGGFLNSLRIAALAHQTGIGYQLGCHPGESPILSAAGRHWACSVASIRYLEGSYDRHLLGVLWSHEDITFGYGGWAPALQGPGLGITIDKSKLQRYAVEQQAVHFA